MKQLSKRLVWLAVLPPLGLALCGAAFLAQDLIEPPAPATEAASAAPTAESRPSPHAPAQPEAAPERTSAPDPVSAKGSPLAALLAAESGDAALAAAPALIAASRRGEVEETALRRALRESRSAAAKVVLLRALLAASPRDLVTTLADVCRTDPSALVQRECLASLIAVGRAEQAQSALTRIAHEEPERFACEVGCFPKCIESK